MSDFSKNMRFLGSEMRAMGASEGCQYTAARDMLLASGFPTDFADLAPIAAYKWEKVAFATLEPGAKLAASLMATKVSPEAVEDVQPPWPSFAVDVPPSVLSDSRAFMLVYSGGDGRYTVMTSYQGLFFAGAVESFSKFAQLEIEFDVRDGNPIGQDVTDHVQRVNALLGRLVVNLCVELDNEEFKKTPSTSLRRTKVDAGGIPAALVYKIGRPVKLDVRGDIRAYVAGGRASVPNVRTLVRGHWKMQPHGVGRGSRKRLHVEPYWRGPEDAPVAVRPHRVGQ